MAENESVTILRIDTNTAVKNVGELREYIKGLKEDLNDENASLEDNKETIEELTKAQNALKEVMHTSTLSVQEARQSFDVAGKTYNELVNQLAELKKVWRTTNDEAARADIAKNINRINDQLKGLDASVGSYKRNVGNYANSIAQVAGLFGSAGGSAAALAGGVGKATMALQAMSATPAIAVLGVLATTLDKVISGLKGSEENTEALSIALAPLKSVSDATTRVMQWLGQALANVAQRIADVLLKLHILKAEALERQQETKDAIALEHRRRQVNEQNAESEQRISELRAKMAETDKYSLKQRKEYAEQWKNELMTIAKRNKEVAEEELRLAEADSKHSDNSKEANDRLSQAKIAVTNATTAYNEQLRTCNKQIAQLNNGLAKNVEVVKEVAESYHYLTAEEIDKVFEEGWKEDEERRKVMEQEVKVLTDGIEAETLEITNAVDAMFNAEVDAMMAGFQKEQEIANAKRTMYQSLADSASSMISSIADAYGDEADMSERQLNQVKGMRIASATIDTISGALGAFMSACETIPAPFGQIVGAAQSAAITASGMAQVRNISKTKISKNSSSRSASVSASTSVPVITTQIPTTRLLTSAQDEEKLNRSLGDQRVVLVYSDVQTASKKVDVQTNESSFS